MRPAPLAFLVMLLAAGPGRAARFDARPDWVARGSGQFVLPDGADVFAAVGKLSGVRNQSLALSASDDRARAALAELVAERGPLDPEAAKALVAPDDVIVDHWRDLSDGTMYALARIDAARVKLAAAEHPAAPVPAPAPAPEAASEAASAPSSPGIDRAELRRMMEEAVRSMNPPKPPEARAKMTSDADVPRYHAAENPDDYAVVVGVEKYAGLPDAAFAEHDAAAVRDHLVAAGYPARNVVLLTGQNASRAGLVKNLEAWLPNNVNSRSTVFFYYSGHGAPDAASHQGYLVPSDGDPQYLEETAYPVKRLYAKLNALKARRVIVALDSCFSGAGGRSVLAKGTRPLVSKIDLGFNGTGKVVGLSASGSAQISGTADDRGHGLFTYYFLKGLDGAAAGPDGHVTLRNLFDYLSPKVRDDAQRQNREQAPQLLLPSGASADFRLR
ncbi:MAG: caspase family protein [Elusimicrobia bacterium]|nr:caspase family protein [Elusimicrobiota bacterium]MDE2511414.1 caspase family protein [Elusimicrobiota bacterium]